MNKILVLSPILSKYNLWLNNIFIQNDINFTLSHDFSSTDILSYTHILCIGQEMLSNINPLLDINKVRGSILYHKSILYIPTLNINDANRDLTLLSLIKQDILKFISISTQNNFKQAERIYTVINNYTEFEYYLPYLNSPVIAFDIETSSTFDITCLGIAISPNETYVIKFTSLSIDECALIWLELKHIFENPDIIKIAHNAVFDIYVIEYTLGIKVVNCKYDTMIMSHLIDPISPHSLAYLTSIYTDISYYKDTSGIDLYRYNAYDCMATFELYEKLMIKLIELNMLELYYNLSKLIPVVVSMQLQGIKIDKIKMEILRKEYEQSIEQLNNEITTFVGFNLNINSPKQMKEYLYNTLNLKPILDRKTKKPITDEDSLLKLYRKYKYPVLQLIMSCRKQRKILSTYLQIPTDDNDKIHSSYNICGTITGRFSSSKSLLKSGMNLQNIPAGIVKSLFLPDDGYILGEIDLSQADARIVAYITKDKNLIELFESGRDVHSENAIRIFKELTPMTRLVAKKLVHAANYGIGANRFMDVVNKAMKDDTVFTLQDSKNALEQYFKAFPSIVIWHHITRTKLLNKEPIITPFNRQITFKFKYSDYIIDQGMLEQALSYVPQSTVADLINLIMSRTYYNMPSNIPFNILMQVHDSFVFQFKPTYKEDVLSVIKNAADITVPINGYEVKIPYNIKLGYNWNDVK